MPQTSTFAQVYLPKFQAHQEEYLHRLATLVNIDSGTGQVDGINQVMAHLQQWLTELDFAVELHPSPDFGANLVARRAGRGRARILIMGHVDTVYAAGAARTQPFALQDGTAYGPGVLDMKSGDIMGLYALRVLLESDFADYKELIVVYNNDEEVGSPASRQLVRELAQQVDYALVLEPAGGLNSLTHARKGSDKYTLEIVGVAAHSGVEPYKGRSAVVELAHKIVAIQNLHAIFPGVTFNITRLGSTEPLNIVPDMARCSLSVRAFSQRGLDAAASALEKICISCSVPDTRAILTRMPSRPPYEPTAGIEQLVALAQQEGEALGLQLKAESKSGVSDANILVAAGVPTLDTLGPVGGGMHNLSREHLRVDSIAMRGALLAGLIRRICFYDPIYFPSR